MYVWVRVGGEHLFVLFCLLNYVLFRMFVGVYAGSSVITFHLIFCAIPLFLYLSISIPLPLYSSRSHQMEKLNDTSRFKADKGFKGAEGGGGGGGGRSEPVQVCNG